VSDTATAFVVASAPVVHSASGTLDRGVAVLTSSAPVVHSCSGTLDKSVGVLVARSATGHSASGYHLWTVIPSVRGGNGTIIPAHAQQRSAGAPPTYDLAFKDSYVPAIVRHWPLAALRIPDPRANYVINPRAHVDVTGWEWSWPGVTRVTVVPGVDLPDGADAAFYSDVTTSGSSLDMEECLLPEYALPSDQLSVSCEYYVEGVEQGDAWISMSIYFYTVNEYHDFGSEDDPLPLSGFVRQEGMALIPEGETAFGFYVTTNALKPGGADQAAIYMTKVMAEISPAPGVYADGDSEGWEWLGTEHASVSRLAT
jgi:hypothetical protein